MELFVGEMKVFDAEEGGAEDEELGDEDEDGWGNLALGWEKEAEKGEEDGGDEGGCCKFVFHGGKGVNG